MLSRTHPAYEFRRGQLQMAQAVEQALEEKRHLIVEAGTGTGKTLAYLLPVIRSGKRVIISTGTKNLQEQLFLQRRPVPRAGALPQRRGQAQRLLHEGPQQLSVPEKALRPDGSAGAQRPGRNRAVPRHRRLGEDDANRRPRRIGILPEASALWHKLDARSDTCLGQKCSAWDRCFITEMHRRAMESDIIIVNHHLFFADLAIKQQAEYAPDAGILPDAGAVIFDEAHELEDVAGSYFGVSVSNLRVEELCRDVEDLAAAQPAALALRSRAR